MTRSWRNHRCVRGSDLISMQSYILCGISSATTLFCCMLVCRRGLLCSQTANNDDRCPDDLPPDVSTAEGNVQEMRGLFQGWDPRYHLKHHISIEIRANKPQTHSPIRENRQRPEMENLSYEGTRHMVQGINPINSNRPIKLTTQPKTEPHRPPRRRLPPNPPLPSPRRRDGHRRRRRPRLPPRRPHKPQLPQLNPHRAYPRSSQNVRVAT